VEDSLFENEVEDDFFVDKKGPDIFGRSNPVGLESKGLEAKPPTKVKERNTTKEKIKEKKNEIKAALGDIWKKFKN